MQSLEPGQRKDALGTLTPWSDNRHLLEAMSEWIRKYLGRFDMNETADHPMVIAMLRLGLTYEVLANLIELMLEVREIADNQRPADAAPRIVELIDAFDVPFYFKGE